MKEEMTQEYLKSILRYNPSTGEFLWLYGTKMKGKIAGFIETNKNYRSWGYVRINHNRKSYRAHRLAFLYVEGYIPENEVDHINGIRHDNRWCNLREVSHQCNMRNRKPTVSNTSGIPGVHFCNTHHRWVSRISTNDKRICLGYFSIIDDAVKARYEAEVKYNWFNCQSESSAYRYLKQKGLID